VYVKYIFEEFVSLSGRCITRLARNLAIFTCGAMFVVAPACAQGNIESCESFPGLQNRMQQVTTLVNSSSVAARINGSENDDAKTLLASARDLVARANLAATTQRCADALVYLNQAVRVTFVAIQQLHNAQSASFDTRGVIENRLASTVALLGALQRIQQEKSAQDTSALALVATIQALVDDAVMYLEKQEYAEASQRVDRAYLLTKTAIVNLRNGDTLTRSLHFQNRDEEYLYELDRSNAHLMLYVLFAKQGMSNADTQVITQYVEQAKTLRASAELLAAEKDFTAAIKELEQSTELLKKAIRGVGVYIP
jgi:hypothetical protein